MVWSHCGYQSGRKDPAQAHVPSVPADLILVKDWQDEKQDGQESRREVVVRIGIW